MFSTTASKLTRLRSNLPVESRRLAVDLAMLRKTSSFLERLSSALESRASSACWSSSVRVRSGSWRPLAAPPSE